MNPVSGPIPGGRRRIDLVLADEFAADLADLPLEQLRGRRREAEQEEVDLSYTRRMLQGRLDILRAEAAARAGDGDGSIIDRLADILGDRTRAEGGDRGLGRHFTVEPSRVDEHRRAVEQAIADVGLSDVSTQTDEALREAIERLAAMEHAVSELRRRVQTVLDALTAEVGRRYADGRANVSDALPN
jgi:hypothetical protein